MELPLDIFALIFDKSHFTQRMMCAIAPAFNFLHSPRPDIEEKMRVLELVEKKDCADWIRIHALIDFPFLYWRLRTCAVEERNARLFRLLMTYEYEIYCDTYIDAIKNDDDEIFAFLLVVEPELAQKALIDHLHLKNKRILARFGHIVYKHVVNERNTGHEPEQARLFPEFRDLGDFWTLRDMYEAYGIDAFKMHKLTRVPYYVIDAADVPTLKLLETQGLYLHQRHVSVTKITREFLEFVTKRDVEIFLYINKLDKEAYDLMREFGYDFDVSNFDDCVHDPRMWAINPDFDVADLEDMVVATIDRDDDDDYDYVNTQFFERIRDLGWVLDTDRVYAQFQYLIEIDAETKVWCPWVLSALILYAHDIFPLSNLEPKINEMLEYGLHHAAFKLYHELQRLPELQRPPTRNPRENY